MRGPAGRLDQRFWRWHALVPASAFGAIAALCAATDLDLRIADAWAWDAAAGRFVGAGPGEWWARELLHAGGGTIIRLAGVVLLLAAGLAWHRPALHAWRRPLACAVVATLASVAMIGLLKNTTNVDCPWALERYGGDRPYVHLFADRRDDLPHAACFPGGHSSSGFVLFALYFALRDGRPRAARASLAGAIALGTLFAFGQEARGAHFLSHDLWSAAIAWFSALGVYAWGFRGRVWAILPA